MNPTGYTPSTVFSLGLLPLLFQVGRCSVLQDPAHKLHVFQVSDGHLQLSDASHAAHEPHIWVKPAQQQMTRIYFSICNVLLIIVCQKEQYELISYYNYYLSQAQG